MAEERDAVAIVYGGEPRAYRLVVGYAFRVHTFGYALDNGRHLQLLLLHHLEIADNVDCGLRRYQGKLVEVFIFKEPVRYLDNAFPAELLAFEVYPYGYLYTWSAGM